MVFMVLQFVSLEVHGLHGLEDFQVDFTDTTQEPVQKILKNLHKITLGEKEISTLFKAHEGEECSCCDDTQSEFIKVNLKVKDSHHRYNYFFHLFLPNEMIFEEALTRDSECLFKKEGGEVRPSHQEAFFERNDYLHFPVSTAENILRFRQQLEKSLAKLLEIA